MINSEKGVRVLKMARTDRQKFIQELLKKELHMILEIEEEVNKSIERFKKKINDSGGTYDEEKNISILEIEINSTMGEDMAKEEIETIANGISLAREAEQLKEITESVNLLRKASQEKVNHHIRKTIIEELEDAKKTNEGLKDGESVFLFDFWTGIIYSIKTNHMNDDDVLKRRDEILEDLFKTGLKKTMVERNNA